MKLILASASERRQELLKRITKEFEIIVSDFDENSIIFQGDCHGYVKELSKGKVLNVKKYVNGEAIIIGCDTIVFLDSNVLGKPKNSNDACEMLRRLSGRVHQVYTGIAILNTASGSIITDSVKTDVKFSELSDEDITNYVESKEPMDKAGAYGIQGLGGVFVEEIHGCYYNVVGLPMNKLKLLLKGMGINL